MRISKGFICFCSIVLMVSLFSNSMVTADTASDVKRKIEQARKKKEAAQRDRKAAQKSIQNNAGQQKEIAQEMDELKNDINDINSNIDLLDSNIKDRIVAINQNNADLEKQNKDLDALNEFFKQRVVSMNEQGTIAYLDVLLGANNFSDFLSQLTKINTIIQHDKQLMKNISDKKAEIVAKNAQNEKEKSDLEDSRSVKLEQERDGQNKLDRQKQLLSDIKKENDQNNQIIQNANKEIEQAEKDEAEQNKILRDLATREQAKSNRAFSGGKFAWPLSGGGTITCGYGYRTDPYPSNHKGVDISGPRGTPILAANDGVVISASLGYNGGYGNCIIIDHGGGIATLYGHADKLLVSVGQEVKRGDKIALEGSTGRSTGPHLRFEVMVKGQNVNPLSYIQ